MLKNMARLRWQCRRGMLELDAILHPFFELHFSSLSPEEQKDFEALLGCSDQDLFSWFLGHGFPSDPNLLSIIRKIKDSYNN